MPLPQPRPRGRTEQHSADAPFGKEVRSKHCFCCSRAIRLKLVVLWEAVLDARASMNCRSWPSLGHDCHSGKSSF